MVIDREVGNWERFKNRRRVGSYTGLCPGQHSSGKTRLQTCVIRLRRTTPGSEPRWSKQPGDWCFQPNYKPVVKWRRILSNGALATGAARKKAIVAVARQLAVDLWQIERASCRERVYSSV